MVFAVALHLNSFASRSIIVLSHGRRRHSVFDWRFRVVPLIRGGGISLLGPLSCFSQTLKLRAHDLVAETQLAQVTPQLRVQSEYVEGSANEGDIIQIATLEA